MSHVTRHTSHVTRHTSHVTHHTSHITRHRLPRRTVPFAASSYGSGGHYADDDADDMSHYLDRSAVTGNYGGMDDDADEEEEEDEDEEEEEDEEEAVAVVGLHDTVDGGARMGLEGGRRPTEVFDGAAAHGSVGSRGGCASPLLQSGEVGACDSWTVMCDV